MSPLPDRRSNLLSEWRERWRRFVRIGRRAFRNLLKRLPIFGAHLSQEERIALLEEHVRELYRNHRRVEARLTQLEEAHTRLSERFSKMIEIQQYTEKRIELLKDTLAKLFQSHEMSEERFRLIEEILNDLTKLSRFLEGQISRGNEIFSLPDLRALSEEEDALWIILRIKGKRLSQNMFSLN
ncbi:MAG: hypothetical protein WHS87_06525 [Anaerolineales bacterium]